MSAETPRMDAALVDAWRIAERYTTFILRDGASYVSADFGQFTVSTDELRQPPAGVNTETGEITPPSDERTGSVPAQEAPTWGDVERLIEATEYANAQELADGIGKGDEAKAAITKHRKGK